MDHPRPPIVLPHDAGYGRHIYNQFVIRCAQRDGLMAHLKTKQIGTEIYYPVPMQVQECFADLGYQVGAFAASEQAAAETLALPIYLELTEEMLGTVVEAVGDFYRESRVSRSQL